MRSQLFNVLTVLILLYVPNLNFGQVPDLGAASDFALFTVTGAFGNTGASTISGDIGSNSENVIGFPPGVVVGTIHNPPDGTTALAATAVASAYVYLSGITCGTVLGTPFGNGQTLVPDVYCLTTASTLNGELILDGGDDPNALFIFKINGALSTNSSSKITLINKASLCNVYWQIGGQLELDDGSVFRGTALVNGAIHLLGNSSLLGRGLSKAGAISTSNNVVRFLPDAAGSIIGNTTVCQGENAEIYTVPIIADAATYSWILPIGAIGTSSTNSITVNYGTSAISGNITVKGNNSCGSDGAISTLAITVNTLPTASTIYHK